MANLTVPVDDELLRAAEAHAARRGTTVDGLVRRHLQDVTGLRPDQTPDGDPLGRFSRGEIGRHEAAQALGVDYGTLLQQLAERGLPLPSLSQDEVERQAEIFVRVWRAAGSA